MDSDKKTSNALLVVLATFVVTVAFLGVVIEYFDRGKEITFWAAPWSVSLDAEIEKPGLPEAASLVVNNQGAKKLYVRQPILIFSRGKSVEATAEIDTSMAKSFVVESEDEKSVTLDMDGLSIRALDGSAMSSSKLAKGDWTVQVVLYTLRENSARPRLAWSDPVSLSPEKMEKSETDMDKDSDMEAEEEAAGDDAAE